jgi:membrane-associated phospholipid phosphatase
MLMSRMKTDQRAVSARSRVREPALPLVPAAARVRAVAWIGCCAALVAIGGAIAAGQPHGNALDRPVDSFIHSEFSPGQGARLAMVGFGLLALYVIVVALVGMCLAARRLNAAVLAVIGVPVASAITELVLKPVVRETISGGLTYPSGHTTNAFALVTVIAVAARLTPSPWLPRWLAALTVTTAACVGCVIALAMVSLDYHYFTDTLAGAAVGTSAVLAVALCLDAPAARSRLGWRSRSAR